MSDFLLDYIIIINIIISINIIIIIDIIDIDDDIYGEGEDGDDEWIWKGVGWLVGLRDSGEARVEGEGTPPIDAPDKGVREMKRENVGRKMWKKMKWMGRRRKAEVTRCV